MKTSIWCFCTVCTATSGQPCTRPNGKKLGALHAARVPRPPTAGELVLVPYGSKGTQIAIACAPPSGGRVLVSKWSDSGNTWHTPATVPLSRVLGFPAHDDARKARAWLVLRDAAQRARGAAPTMSADMLRAVEAQAGVT